MKPLLFLAAVSGLAAVVPAAAADLRLLHRDEATVVFADLDALRTDAAGLRHGVVYQVSAAPLPITQAEVSRFEDVADCGGRRITTAVVTGFSRDLMEVQRLALPPRWAAPDSVNQGEFDLLCGGGVAPGRLRRLPTGDWKAAAAQFLGAFERLHHRDAARH